MSPERPFFIKGKVVELSKWHPFAIVKAVNGYSYNVHDDTPGIEFDKLVVDMIIEVEITSRLNKVYSARIIHDTQTDRVESKSKDNLS